MAFFRYVPIICLAYNIQYYRSFDSSILFEKWWVVIVAILYFFFAPYGHEEEIRNCQTLNGYTVSIIVQFKEPIVKLLWTKPTDVQVMAIDGQEYRIKLSESSSKKVYNATVFEGRFSENGKSNTLLLIL